MRKFFITIVLFLLVASNVFTETYGQIDNRFVLWYTENIWNKLDEKVNSAISQFNEQKTYLNAGTVMIWVCARYAYWKTAEKTAEVLFEQFGDSYGNFQYSKIFHQAGENTKKFNKECFEYNIFYLENYPEWNLNPFIDLSLYGYYDNFFNVATRL